MSLNSLWESFLSGAEAEVRRFSLNELQIATQNFSDSYIISSADKNVFYRGVLTSSLKEVTVKKVDVLNADKTSEGWEVELSVLLRIRHPNIIKLHGFGAVEESRFLVYDYFPNHSLYHYLASDDHILSWEQRFTMIFGLAEGLKYLHQLQPPIILNNFNSSVILLKSCMMSEFCDTYSFGIVLMEILSGRSASRPVGEKSLKEEFIEAYFSDREAEFLDNRLVFSVAARAILDICYFVTGAGNSSITMELVLIKLRSIMDGRTGR
ncbi:hypothetical protein AQUCO_00901077v1 [Aquilegia coerulea]|uniref:Protein kinase domain-containing protein n=1 Tax=Aquilegia coerulea TaxID=218851 RepID=A0A2G5EGS9_AQUCA|nr:hypothetical protein AQUCO_00901077v1 [Aquilegia coerulea]